MNFFLGPNPLATNRAQDFAPYITSGFFWRRVDPLNTYKFRKSWFWHFQNSVLEKISQFCQNLLSFDKNILSFLQNFQHVKFSQKNWLKMIKLRLNLENFYHFVTYFLKHCLFSIIFALNIFFKILENSYFLVLQFFLSFAKKIGSQFWHFLSKIKPVTMVVDLWNIFTQGL